MTERDAARAQAEAVHQARTQEIRDERRTTRMDQTVQRYLASAYYAIVSRGTRRPGGDEGVNRTREHREPETRGDS